MPPSRQPGLGPEIFLSDGEQILGVEPAADSSVSELPEKLAVLGQYLARVVHHFGPVLGAAEVFLDRELHGLVHASGVRCRRGPATRIQSPVAK